MKCIVLILFITVSVFVLGFVLRLLVKMKYKKVKSQPVVNFKYMSLNQGGEKDVKQYIRHTNGKAR